mmetsp:Transcript_19202/g.41518  ORF Transcript_19202/g.41518 Transcript_19202/m.41518 type:complete len:201 (-) Transcript_19202:213-815(-)
MSSASISSSTGMAFTSLSTRALSGPTAGLSANASTKHLPSSHAFSKLGSSGSPPKYGTLNCSAIPLGPPPDAGNTSAVAIISSTSGHFSRSISNTSSVHSTVVPSPLLPLALPFAPSAAVAGRRNPSDDTLLLYCAIFSTTPTTLTFVLTQKFSSFLTSLMETSSGVVTTTAPLTPPTACRYCTVLICSSDVPGGVSMIR